MKNIIAMAKTKKCTKCGRELPLSEFYNDSTKKDGHSSLCKRCILLRVKKYDSEHRKEKAEYSRLWRSTHKGHVSCYNKEYYNTHRKRHNS